MEFLAEASGTCIHTSNVADGPAEDYQPESAKRVCLQGPLPIPSETLQWSGILQAMQPARGIWLWLKSYLAAGRQHLAVL